MDFNDAFSRALAQAREMQKQAIEAANTAAEQMRPHIQKSLDNAKELQATLNEHAAESSDLASRQAQAALSHLGEYIKMGTDAMRDSTEATRATALKMVEQSRKIVEAATDAMTTEAMKGPDA